MSSPRVTIISTGEELVTGHTVDTNASFLAERLTTFGFIVQRLVALGDDPEALHRELRWAAQENEILIVTGGLGPTADDRTRGAVARAAGVELVEDKDSLEHVRRIIESYGRAMTPAQAVQALFPAGSEIFPNSRGTARGFAVRVGPARVIVMPGVPDEMKAMFQDSVLPSLRAGRQETAIARTVNLFGVAESEVDARISDLMQVGRNPSVGLKVEGGAVYVCLHAQAGSAQEAARLIELDVQTIRDRFGDAVYGGDATTLAGALSRLLEEQNLNVAVAESCTGGLIGSLLTDVPGISRFFLLDVVAYSDEAKVRELRVPAEEIKSFGAVSPQVAQSMARGVCETSGAALGISTTGIAGPTGGTPQKPVGLVYIGLCLNGQTTVHALQLRGDRWRIKARAAANALNFARLALLQRASSARQAGRNR